jgi:hypothetical protein
MSIRSFALFESSDNYIFNNELVKLLSKQTVAGEVRVQYQTIDGNKHGYTADTIKEFDDDFKKTETDFKVKKAKKAKKEKKKDKKPIFSNVVYYYGARKSETIHRNIPQKMAYGLKNKLKYDPRYKMGKIVIEDIKQPITEKAGIIPGYTDPNKDNLKYNWSAVPKRDKKKKIEGLNMLSISEIPIGDKNAVLKFKEWNGKYWEKSNKKKKKLNESSNNFVGIHCSPKMFNDDYSGKITDEYYNSYKKILELIVQDYPESRKYLQQIELLNDDLSLDNDSVDLVFDIESFFSDNFIEWIYVAPEALTKYGDNCYNVYFTDLSKSYSMHDELVENATIYIYNAKNNKPVLEKIF